MMAKQMDLEKFKTAARLIDKDNRFTPSFINGQFTIHNMQNLCIFHSDKAEEALSFLAARVKVEF